MNQAESKQNETVEVNQPGTDNVNKKETKKKKQYLMLSSQTRFYGFRNTLRLTALKRFIWLFVVTSVLGLLSIIIGAGIFAVWFILFIITISLISKYNDNWFNVIGKFIAGGGILFVASIILKIIIEFIYTRIEKFELKRQPDGAEKYLTVMKASAKIRLINLVLGAVVIALGALAYSTGLGENAETIIFVVVAIAAFITSRVVLQKVYGKITDEIIEIRKERQSDKYKAS